MRSCLYGNESDLHDGKICCTFVTDWIGGVWVFLANNLSGGLHIAQMWLWGGTLLSYQKVTKLDVKMIDKQLLKSTVESAIAGTEMFLVDVQVSPSNAIVV